MSEFDLLPDQPTTYEKVRRFGPTAVIAVVALLFIVQNTNSVQFNFLWFEFRWPLWIMLLVFTLVGIAIFYGAARRRRARQKKAAEFAAADDE